MEERKDLIQWIKEHRKQLILAGVGVGTLILFVFGIKNQEEIKAVWKSLEGVVRYPTVKVNGEVTKAITETTPALVPEIGAVVSNSETLPFEVSRHIRNLPEGWHASPEKVAEALKNNITLQEGQTWVDSYLKGGAVA